MWPFSKDLKKVLYATKKIKVCGIIFLIRKINPMDYLAGANVLTTSFDTYSETKDPNKTTNPNKIKKHYSEVILASVVEPKLSRSQNEDGIYIDHLFTDWDLAIGLYEKIIEFSYGKKKLKSLGFHAKS